jgi:hypothetical protein
MGQQDAERSVWVPETRLTPSDQLLRRRRKLGMIPGWRCG